MILVNDLVDSWSHTIDLLVESTMDLNQDCLLPNKIFLFQAELT